MINLKQVSKKYPNGVKALNHLDLNIDKGEFVYIIGPTGSGKSTLIKLLNSEELPDSGTIEVNGRIVNKIKNNKIHLYRRSIGVVFQDFQLLEKKNVFENIAFALEVINMPKAQIRSRVRELLKLVDLEEKANSFPDQLSGGQKQRVAIARAIANNPVILIADEPTGNLDPNKSLEIMELLEKINQEKNTTILVVTHDKVLVNEKKKRTIILEHGFLTADLKQGGYLK